MYVVEVMGVTENSDDGSDTSQSTNESPNTDNPSTRRRQRCSPVSKPATNPWGKVCKSSLDDALRRYKRIPYWHREG